MKEPREPGAPHWTVFQGDEARTWNRKAVCCRCLLKSPTLIVSTCCSTVRVTPLGDSMAFPNISSFFPLMLISVLGEIYIIS